MKACV